MKTNYYSAAARPKSRPHRSGVINSCEQYINIRYTLIWMILLVCLVVFGCLPLTADKLIANNVETAPNDFLDLLVKNKVSRIEIYYTSWTVKHWQLTFFEDDLINKQRDLKVVAYTGRIVFQGHFLRNLERILREFKFTRIQPGTRDFRLGCLFYSGDKEVLRIFFSTRDPAMSINGISYKIDLELIRIFFSFLPPQARDEIDRAMLQYWVRSGTSLQE